MPVASVTIESLNNVKKAFSDFQTDVESFSDKINSSTEQILTEVKQSVKKQENLVVVLEKKVSSLVNEIEQIQSSIISVNSRISSLKTEIVNLERQKPQLEACISQLEQQKRQIEAQKNNSDGDTSGIGAQIRAIENQIQSCRRQLQQINEQISSAKQQQADNERKSAELKDCKVQKDNELSTTKSELSKAKSKFERLSAAGDSVEREIGNLNIAARKFEQNTSSSSETSKSGLSKCIASIDEYLAVNLGTVSSGNGERASTSQFASSQEYSHQYSSSNEMPDNVYSLACGYQGNPEWNVTIRSGNTTPDIDAFRDVIQQHHLSGNAHFVRRASLADMGAELQNLPIEELQGHSYPFIGIMSASATQEMADAVSWGQNENVIYEISAPAGFAALDLTNLPDFQEVMFDAPMCRIESAEMCGYNTIRVNITVGENNGLTQM